MELRLRAAPPGPPQLGPQRLEQARVGSQNPPAVAGPNAPDSSHSVHTQKSNASTG